MEYKLFFFLVGGKLPGRFTEQHDVFFGVGKTVVDLIPALNSFWPEAQNFHIDCWREVTNVNGHIVKAQLKSQPPEINNGLSLFFINLGGYQKGAFNEFHSLELVTALNQQEAIKAVKKTTFYTQYGFKGAVAHIDNKYGVDIDDIYPVEEILSKPDKENYRIIVTTELAGQADELHLGYTPLSRLKAFI